jgi:hypothetical protein
MADFTIETTYLLPVFRHRTYTAEALETACRAAIEDDDWEIAEKDYDSSRQVHVSGVWEGMHAAYTGPSIPVPPQFEEAVQRRARHFEILLGLLKIFFDDAHAAREPSLDWLARAAWEIARGEAILAGVPDSERACRPTEACPRSRPAGGRSGSRRDPRHSRSRSPVWWTLDRGSEL